MGNCLDCKFAKWQMTKHNPPRINKSVYGLCQFVVDVDLLPLPATVNKRDLQLACNPNGGRREFGHTIWVDSLPGECRVWQARDEGN